MSPEPQALAFALFAVLALALALGLSRVRGEFSAALILSSFGVVSALALAARGAGETSIVVALGAGGVGFVLAAGAALLNAEAAPPGLAPGAPPRLAPVLAAVAIGCTASVGWWSGPGAAPIAPDLETLAEGARVGRGLLAGDPPLDPVSTALTRYRPLDAALLAALALVGGLAVFGLLGFGERSPLTAAPAPTRRREGGE